jgi:hypothetical protein
MSTRVVDVMATDVVAVRASASFKEIAARLREQHVSAFAVLDSAFAVLDADNKVVGVVSKRICCRRRLLAGRVATSLAATTGVEDPSDVARYLLVGADVVMTVSALIRHARRTLASCSTGCPRGCPARVSPRWPSRAVCCPSPADADGAAYERAGYVRELQAANRGHGPW